MRAARSLSLVLLLAARTVAAADSAPPRDTAYNFLLAQSLADEQRFDEALAELGRAVAGAPDDAYLRIYRAGVLLRLDRVDEALKDALEARRLAPAEPEAMRLLGRIELARVEEDPAAQQIALEAFEALRAREPEDLEVLVALGQLYLRGGQATLAVEVLSDAARLRPDHPWIESLRARALAAAGESNEAEQIQRKSLERNPADLAARFELFERLLRSDRGAEAVSLLDAAPPAQRALPELRERLVRALFAAGSLDRAESTATALLADRPDATALRPLLARVELALGRFAEAEATLAPLADQVVERDMVADLYVRALEGQGKVEAAAEVLTRKAEALRRLDRATAADAIDLDHARLAVRASRWDEGALFAERAAASADAEIAGEGFRLLLSALQEGGHGDEALARLKRAPGDADEYTWLELDLLFRSGHADEGRAEAERLLASRTEAALGVGGVYADLGELAKAVPLLERAHAAMPDSIEAAFRLASCYERLGRGGEAVPLLQAVITRAPRFAVALNYLGYYWIDRGENLERAVEMVREATRLDPDNGAYVDSLGWGQFQLGQYADAVRLLERAARLLTSDATVLEHLGDARAAAGDPAGALEAYRRALTFAGDHAADLQRKIARLPGGG